MAKNLESKKSLSRRNKLIFIKKESYIYNFIHTLDKGKLELYRCRDYKSIYRYEAFIHSKVIQKILLNSKINIIILLII